MSSHHQSLPNTVMCVDAHLLKRSRSGRPLSTVKRTKLQRSEKEVKRRQSLVPQTFPATTLPIKDSLPEIHTLLKQHQVIIVAGETGSGKTTQLPIECLRVGLGARGMIGHTQPRRLAARSVSRRIAEQLNVSLGEQVGYAVRFEDQTSKNTLVKLLTDGLLLTEIQHDPSLNAYDTIIVDEAHERSLNVDLLLGYLKKLLNKRRDLKVIITSATIDVASFSDFFEQAPVVQVEGRAYPVDIRYRTVATDEEQVLKHCIQEIEQEPYSEVQDVLIFLAGEREIFHWSRWFRRHYGSMYEILPLYSRLPPREQQRIFVPSKTRRILLATNVAETSLTVPNIKFVIDFGRARISRYSLTSRIQQLPIERISQASANQRAGRCGRLAPGVCFRLYDEADFLKRDQYVVPEIKRTNLASVVLQIKAFGFGSIETFPFLDRPTDRAFTAALKLLEELGALIDDRITMRGKKMATIPVDARLARMLLEAHKQQSLREVLIIVSALAIQDPFQRPLDKQQPADQAHQQFKDAKSDFQIYINLWNWAEKSRRDLSRNAFQRALENAFVSRVRYEEWRSLHRQLSLSCKRLGMRLNKHNASFKEIHCALLSGSLGFIGYRIDDDRYVGVKGTNFFLFPGSTLAPKKPKWIMSAEVFETSNKFARGIVGIHPNWIEHYAEHIATKKHHDPYWDTSRNEGMILLDISVYGLLIVKDRIVRLSDVDKNVAREFFLLHGLVKSKVSVECKEIQRNQTLVTTLIELQIRHRRLDLVAGDEHLREFYRERLPANVMSTSSLVVWYRQASSSEKARLQMLPEHVLRKKAIHLREDAFPSTLKIKSREYPLQYVFGPGQPDDGVSVQVSSSELAELSAAALEWVVPGFLEEKCQELLRGLPKNIRKNLSPIADHLKQILPTLVSPEVFRVGRFVEALSREIHNKFKVSIDPRLWDLSKLSRHLTMNVQICSDDNIVIDQDRDVEMLCARHIASISKQVDEKHLAKYEQMGLTQYPKSGLNAQFKVEYFGGSCLVYTVLEDQISSVDLRVEVAPKRQHQKNLRGLCRFVVLQEGQSKRYLQGEFNKDLRLLQHAAEVIEASNFFDDILLTSIKKIFFIKGSLPSTRAEFNTLVRSRRSELIPQTLELMNWVSDVVSQRKQIVLALDQLTSPAYDMSKQDAFSQLDTLFAEGFPYILSQSILENIPRYLKALLHRISSLQGRLSKDQLGVQEIQTWEKRMLLLTDNEIGTDTRDHLFQLLQEFRISLFYQGMKTKVPVSVKRLEKVFEKYEPPQEN
ncbi:MAG: ATP-dependent RNA helicase HrpA [Gammaproteobacteria bacterium]|nr:ATP-dependent RNA helicase HrpA [Gammaproteobacteria bacterium]MYK44570.1 ATP-dependent RNA helicase HrpA [Gammaproteobacteria bacterium]